MSKLGRDFNDVFVFMHVVKAHSFTAAGKQLGLPKSTVSRRVSRLEDDLGMRLLRRTTRKLSLTEAGREYFERAEGLFDGLVESEARLAEAQAVPKGRVRVVAPAEHRVSTALAAQFLTEYPDVRVDMELTSRPVNILEEAFDVAISAGPLTNLSVVAHKLHVSPFRLVASPAYLDARGAPPSIQALADHDTLVFGAYSPNLVWTFGGDDPLRIPLQPRASFNHLEGVRAAALAGHGIAMLPLMTCGRDIDAGTLDVVLPDISPPPVTIWLTHPAGRYLPSAARAFIDFAKKRFSDLAERMN